MLNKILFISLIGFLVFASLVFAQNPGPGGNTGPAAAPITLLEPLNCVHQGGECVGEILGRIISNLLPIIYSLVVLMVIVGGFQMLASGGDPEKFKTGRRTILYAVIGLVIIILGQGAVFVIQSIVNPG